jgi:hypothetical protein
MAPYAPFADCQRWVTKFGGIILEKIEKFPSCPGNFPREGHLRRNHFLRTSRETLTYYVSRVPCFSRITAKLSRSRELWPVSVQRNLLLLFYKHAAQLLQMALDFRGFCHSE